MIKNIFYRIYYFLFLKNEVIGALIKRFYWVEDKKVSGSSFISYKPIGLEYTKTIYMNFHCPSYEIFFTNQKRSTISFNLIAILSDDKSLNKICIFGRFKIKIIRWYFKDRFYSNMVDYQLNVRNGKLNKITNIAKD